MAVTIKVNGVANSLVHKGSNGMSMATMPDVCKTPSPGGPVPIPYPNMSQSATLAKGTTTVKADGGMMIGIKGSEFSLSNGDNAGVAGGVKSSTFMKESTWILYSFDVKMDGKNACRLSDKKFQNHENTVDLGGEFQSPAAAQATLAQWVKDCDQSVTKSKGGKKKSCQQLGREKHDCMEKKIEDYRKKNPQSDPAPPGHPEGERGYPRPPSDGSPFVTPPGGPGRNSVISGAIAQAKSTIASQGLTGSAAKKAVSQSIGKALRGNVFPDAAINLGGGKKMFVDFKFPCPKGQPTGHKRGSRNRLSKGSSNTQMSESQRKAYTRLSAGTGSSVPAKSLNPSGYF
jgi:hypothetical protein